MSDFPLFPAQASTIAWQVDALYAFLLALTVLFCLLVFGMVIIFAIKYRRRSEDEQPEQTHGNLVLELSWTIIPLFLALFVFLLGADVFFRLQRPPSDPLEIYAVGKQWMWKIQHESGKREINTLHVPKGQPVRLTMTSEDVIHDFFIPAFRVKNDVLPGRYTTLWFEATQTGEFHLFCAEYCGTQHSGMIGKVIVLEPAEVPRLADGSVQRRIHGRGGRTPVPATRLRDLPQIYGHRSRPFFGRDLRQAGNAQQRAGDRRR